MRIKENNGITLIALVLTIIVLLILAGVSIAMLTGDNGILTQTQKAKEETERASEDELRKLTISEATTHIEEYEYEDSSGAKITIPAKCAVSQVDGENILENGLVIIDENGNEWVWVEISKEQVFSTSNNSMDFENIEKDLKAYSYIYSEGSEGQGRYWTDEYYEGCGVPDKSTYDKMYKDMLSSIYTNGGFWIGRYETGYSATAPRTENSNIENAKIQRNLYPYNFVTCSQAQTLASNISPNENKTTSLPFGIQWDLVCKFLEEKTSLNVSEIKSDSTSWGNYSNATFKLTYGKYAVYNQNMNLLENWDVIQSSKYTKKNSGTDNMVLLSTGASDYTKKMNIYDLAGNMWEWTLEQAPFDGDNKTTRRGCGYRNPGNTHCAAKKGIGTISEIWDSVGFRIVMY